uniref:pleckstrin homology domain-containing family G member 4B-like isoform X2 n=1 Tax=Myxine glutinosa TaxID=7769 RepID=UPI00358E8BAC
MDWGSLDASVQSVLSCLYPPFELTAPTVLSQVLAVWEQDFAADGLQYLVSFLIPAKHLLQCVQQAACSNYPGFLFRHEGWPLCLGPLIAVHLAELDPRALRPRDFYLQVVLDAQPESKPRIVLKCLSRRGLRHPRHRHRCHRSLQEVPIPEELCTAIFTMEFLHDVSAERGGSPLESCILAGSDGLHRMTWKELVTPEFVDCPRICGTKISGEGEPQAVNPNNGRALFERTVEQLKDKNCTIEEEVFSSPETLAHCTVLSDNMKKAYWHLDHFSISKEDEVVSTNFATTDAIQTRGLSDASLPGEHKVLDLVTQNQQKAEPLVSLPAYSSSPTFLPTAHTDIFAALNDGQKQRWEPTGFSESHNSICTSILQNEDDTASSKVLCESLMERSKSLPSGESSTMPCSQKGNPQVFHTTMLPGSAFSDIGQCCSNEDYVEMLPFPGSSCFCNRCMTLESQVKLCERNNSSGDTSGEHSDAFFSRDICNTVSDDDHTFGTVSHSKALQNTGKTHSDFHHERGTEREFGDTRLFPRDFDKLTDPGSPPSCDVDTLSFPRIATSFSDGVDCFDFVTGGIMSVSSDQKANCKKVMAKDHTEFFTKVGQPPSSPSEVGLVDVFKENQHVREAPEMGNELCRPSDADTGDALEREIAEISLAEKDECYHQCAVECGALSVESTPALKENITEVPRKSFTCILRTAEVPGCSMGNQNMNEIISSTSRLCSNAPCTFEDDNAVEDACEESMMDTNSSGELGQLPTATEAAKTSPCVQAPSQHEGFTTRTNCIAPNASQKIIFTQTFDSMNQPVPSNLITQPGCSISEGQTRKHIDAAEMCRKSATVPKTSALSMKSVPLSNGDLQENSQEKCTQGCGSVSFPTLAAHVDKEILHSGAVMLPGSRDRTGRALVIISTRSPVWSSPRCTGLQVAQLLLYYHSLPRKEGAGQGLVVLMDARRCRPEPTLFKAFAILQDAAPKCLYSMMIMLEQEENFHLDTYLAIQCELITSMKSLHKHVESSQLPPTLNGSFNYSHEDWVDFRLRLEPFITSCQGAVNLLQSSIATLKCSHLPDDIKEVQAKKEEHDGIMRSVLSDSRLVRLQREGGATLARLKREQQAHLVFDDCRLAVENVALLYGEVEEKLHELVTLSNSHLHCLDYLMTFLPLQQKASEIQKWMDGEGESCLKQTDSLPDSLENMQITHSKFQDFYTVAKHHCEEAAVLLSEAESCSPDHNRGLVKEAGAIQAFRKRADAFRSRLEVRQGQMEKALRLYQFLDKAYEWSLESIRRLPQLSLQKGEAAISPATSQDVAHRLQAYRRENPELPQSMFTEMEDLAKELSRDMGKPGLMCQYQFARDKCLEASQAFLRKLPVTMNSNTAELRPSSQGTQPTRSRHTATTSQFSEEEEKGEEEDAGLDINDSRVDNIFRSMDSLVTHASPDHWGGPRRFSEADYSSEVQGSRLSSFKELALRLGRRTGLISPHGDFLSPFSREQGSRRLSMNASLPDGNPQQCHRDVGKTTQVFQAENRASRRECKLRTRSSSSQLDSCPVARSGCSPAHFDQRRYSQALPVDLDAVGPWDLGSTCSSSSSSSEWALDRRRSVSICDVPHANDNSVHTSEYHFPVSNRVAGRPSRKLQRIQSESPSSACFNKETLSTSPLSIFRPNITNDSHAVRRGNTGVFIRGLEVASTVAVDAEFPARPPGTRSPVRSLSPITARPALHRTVSMPSHNGFTDTDCMNYGSKLLHLASEMLLSEREYVRALDYIMHNFISELDRADAPAELRGRQSLLFGNLHKLWEFHGQYFLRELETCTNYPLRIGSCFLRYEKQFEMYALYSKNKPQSDALMSSYGNVFFQQKQLALGDKMDLSSYLLKPIQRMTEQELGDLRTALELIRFQLRHGNDLLAMDSICNCDVNLKEQGQLLRQDEFIVSIGRRKQRRRVFLFHELILFSKTKRADAGHDIYVYKKSFKTAELGMTESVGDSGLCFELWFRRRKSNDTHALQAASPDLKDSWTNDISHILWKQALRNRQSRLQELVSMGIGNKPYHDISPSSEAINNRAIDLFAKGRGSRTRASIAVSSFDHISPFKRPHSTISSSSTTSSSSGSQVSAASQLSSLNLHLQSSHISFSPPSAWPTPLLSPARSSDFHPCIEEEEIEQDSSSQPSMATESSESSQGTTSVSRDGSFTSHAPPDHMVEDASHDAQISVKNGSTHSTSQIPHSTHSFPSSEPSTPLSAQASGLSLSTPPESPTLPARQEFVDDNTSSSSTTV